MVFGRKKNLVTRWAPTSDKWSNMPYKWPCEWVTVVITHTYRGLSLVGVHLVPSCHVFVTQLCQKERIQVGSTDYDDLDAEGAYGRSVADVLAELHDLEQTLPNSTRLLIGGFSQGAAIALECALKYPKPLAGCIVLAGWARPTVREFLAEGSTSKTQTPFLLCHGEADDVVDVNCSRILKDLLSKKGAEVQLQTYPGIQHESCPELLNAVMESKMLIFRHAFYFFMFTPKTCWNLNRWTNLSSVVFFTW